MDYRVELDAYAGPMDLLLYLIKEAEVDIYDIPVAEITDKYLGHLEAIEKIDLNRAGEFLVVASQLMEIKAKMLIPRETIDLDDVQDPRAGLVQELLEYRKFKDASRQLGERLGEEDGRFPRPRLPDPEGEPPDLEEEDLEDLGVYDLLTAFGRIRKEILDAAPPSIIYDDIPIRVHMQQILDLLEERAAISFRDLILSAKERREMIGVFLALLELVKLRCIRARQSEDGEDILISSREGGLPIPSEVTSAADLARLEEEMAPAPEPAQEEPGTEPPPEQAGADPESPMLEPGTEPMSRTEESEPPETIPPES